MVGVIINIYLYINKPTNKDIQNNNNSQVNLEDSSQKDVKSLHRPIALMINNIPEALPQSGIYYADYVYELLVEGGYSRLMAIYTKDIDISKIGPIRSARHYFLDIVMEYDAIYGHFGGSNRAFKDISTLKIAGLNGIALDGKMYWRDKSRKAPHNAYTSLQKVLEYSEKYGYNKTVSNNHFNYDDSEKQLNGNSALKVYIPYSYSHNVSYEYDSMTKLYKRFMKGKLHVDELINSQLTAKNIIIQYAKNSEFMSDENKQEIYLTSSGSGYYITDGKYISITWKKPSRSEKTIFYDSLGNQLNLNKGQTWIQVVPLDSRVSIQ